MFTGIGNLIEEAGLLIQDKGYKATHPSTWTGNGGEAVVKDDGLSLEEYLETLELEEEEDEEDIVLKKVSVCPAWRVPAPKINKYKEEIDDDFHDDKSVLNDLDNEEVKMKTDCLNRLCKNIIESDKKKLISQIDELQALLCFMKKNISGELTAKDVKDAEIKMQDWMKCIEELKREMFAITV